MTDPDVLPVLEVDDALLALDDWSLLRELGRTSVLVARGHGSAAPRAVLTLQHGDEPTGLQAVLRILRRRPVLPFDLHVVVGNVAAALEPPGFAHRFLPGQRDMNRLWTLASPDDAQSVAVAAVREHLRALPLASVVDLHNTSGANPFHALVSRAEPVAIDLATRFTTTVVHWEQRVGALMEALADHAPTVAVECGLAGRPASLAFALDGVRRWLGGPDPAPAPIDHDLLGPMRRVLVDPGARFRFGGVPDDEVDLCVDIDADQRNGLPTPAGWALARLRPGTPLPLTVLEPDGRDVTDRVLAVRGDEVVTLVDATPLMMTRTVDAARKDCLTYLLGTVALPTATASSHPSASRPANRSDSGRTVGTALSSSVNASNG